jgi:hypothetical protein
MDEMKMLQDRHDAQSSPSPDFIAEARARLVAHTRPESRQRRRGFRIPQLSWPRMAALGLTATAAAAAVAVAVTGAGTAPQVPDAKHPQQVQLSASKVLLAAAHQAELASTTGKYWHVKTLTTSDGSDLTEEWTTRDGKFWLGRRVLTAAKTPEGPPPKAGTATLIADKSRFSICSKDATFKEVAALPSDPAGLKVVMMKSMERYAALHNQQTNLAGCLTDLLADVPASPKVRAAAFKALAQMSNVTLEGKTTDSRGRAGIAITIKDQRNSWRLVIDPRTSLVLSEQTTFFIGDTRMRSSSVYLAVGWTNEKPHVPTNS